MKFAAWYGIVVGILMAAQWTFFLATGSVPELSTTPWEIGFHLAGEFLTAAALVVGGTALLRGRKRADIFLAGALGMVIYSEIVSPGYFAQQGSWPLVAMFALLLGLAVVALVLLVRKNAGSGAGL